MPPADADLEMIDPWAPVDASAARMERACTTSGFFRLPLDVVPRSVADDAWETAAAFFALDDAEKAAVAFPEPGAPYGWASYGYETLARSLADGPAAPDMKESLSVGPDCALAPPTRAPSDPAEAWIRSPSLWPAQPAGLRAAWVAYYRALSDVAARLMSIMAVALDLPPDHFEPLIDRPITSMRAISYPAITGTPPSGALRAGAHSDYGTLTILRADAVPGLQILDADGSWRDVSTSPDEFVVNLGDSIAQWTNDRWRSTIHRVDARDPRPRQSFAFFHMANWDAVIECLPTCREPGTSPRHEPVVAGPWLMRKFRATVT